MICMVLRFFLHYVPNAGIPNIWIPNVWIPIVGLLPEAAAQPPVKCVGYGGDGCTSVHPYNLLVNRYSLVSLSFL